MLARMFPRTVLSAGVETVTRAAAIVHDGQIGRLGAYHLFRLPTAEELALAAWLRVPESDALLQELSDLADRQARLDARSALAAGERLPDAYGPMHLGSPAGLRRGKLVGRICAAYLDAFDSGRTAFPFLLDGAAL